MTTETHSLPGTNSRHSLILLLSALSITMLLFFVDEGYYNFKWMLQWGNWVPFMVYVSVIFLLQLFVYKIMLRKYHGQGKVALSILGGTILGLLIVIFGIFTRW